MVLSIPTWPTLDFPENNITFVMMHDLLSQQTDGHAHKPIMINQQ